MKHESTLYSRDSGTAHVHTPPGTHTYFLYILIDILKFYTRNLQDANCDSRMQKTQLRYFKHTLYTYS